MNQKELNSIVSRVFNTLDGKQLLGFLEYEYGERQSAVKGDSHMTYFREGQRSVLNLIKECIKGESDELV